MTVSVDGDLGTAYARLPALPASVGEARRLVRQALNDRGRTDLVDNAELVVSEAVTNALVHAGTTIDVRVLFPDGRVRLEVGDGSSHLPTPRSYAATAGTGRGLTLIDGLTESWGTVPRTGGKTVWFELSPAADPIASATALLIEGGSPTGSATRQAGPGRARPEGASVQVQLFAFPVLLYIAWREYAEALLRDFLLAELDEEDDEEAVRLHAESSQALALLAEHISTAPLSEDPQQVLADAAVPARTTAKVRLSLPPDTLRLFATLDDTLEAAGQMSELATFLTAPVQPEMRQFRQWLCGQVASQGAGSRPRPWSPHPYAAVPLPRASEPVAWDLARVTGSRQALVAADDSNGIVAVSDAAARLLGYDRPEDLVGQRLVSIIPDRFRQAHVAGFTLHLLNGRSALLNTQVVVPLRRRHGTETTATLTISTHRTNDGREVFVAAMVPVEGGDPQSGH
jgi:PAS domain S-box-containing protein